ncbi:Protein CREG1 [Camponotus japonicus]
MMLRIASVIAFCVLLSEARIFNVQGFKTHHSHHRPYDLPPANQSALVARYVVNHADWAAVATISTRNDIKTYPVANLVSISDGPTGNGTGIPYMYLTPLDYTAQDLDKDHRATLLVSLAEGSYCKYKHLDPMDPRCARVTLTGKIVAVNDTAEQKTAAQLFFGRHPELKDVPADHKFFFCKLDIFEIVILNNYGGPINITVLNYYHPPVYHAVNKLYEHSFVEHRV